MKVKTYKSKPTIVKAILFTKENIDEILKWCPDSKLRHIAGEPCISFRNEVYNQYYAVYLGQYVCLGSNPGDFYSCRADVFEKRYVVD